MYSKEGAVENFTKFTGKNLSQSLFLNKVAGPRPYFTEKGTLAHVFSSEFYEIFKNTFFIEHLWKLLLAIQISSIWIPTYVAFNYPVPVPPL